MFLPRKRKGASFLIMVVIMALVMSIFAISVTQLSRSRSATLISDATEKQVLYLAEDAANQMILQLNSGSTAPIGLTPATELGANYRYEASYAPGTKPFGKGSGTVMGKASLVDGAGNDIYSKTVYAEVLERSNAKPLMVYAKANVPNGPIKNTPFYRVWNGADWGGLDKPAIPLERESPPLGDDSTVEIQFVRLVYSPNGSEAILGAQDGRGNIWAQEYDVLGDLWSGLILVCDSGRTSSTTPPGRYFDVAYENSTTLVDGKDVYRAILVCRDPDGGRVPLYSTWDGASWTPIGEWEWNEDHDGHWTADNWSSSPGASVENVPDSMSRPAFIELATNPMTTGGRSKEIGMIYQDSNRRVFGEVWDGTAWSAPSSSVWSRVESSAGRAIGIAYEQTSGDLMFVYAKQVSSRWTERYRVWDGTSLSVETTVLGTSDKTIRWLQLNRVPGTNTVVSSFADSSRRLYTTNWDGTAWDSTLVPHGNTYGTGSPFFDFASSGADKGTLVFSSSEEGPHPDHTPIYSLTARTWSGGTTWTLLGTTPGWTRSHAVIVASPTNIFSGYYNDVANANVLEWHTHGSADTVGTWRTFPFGNTLSPAYERIAIAIPAASGSGFTVVKGTWREDY
jgi:hypothetical protein